MKLYLATNISNGTPRRYILLTFAGITTALKLSSDVIIGATVLDRHQTNWAFVDYSYVTDLREMLAWVVLHPSTPSVHGMFIKEMDKTERNWLMGVCGKDAFKHLQHEIYNSLGSGYKSRKWDNIITKKLLRLSGDKESANIHYHQVTYPTNLHYRVTEYRSQRDFYKQLGIYVREAIKDRDINDLANHIVDYASDNVINSRVFHDLKDMLILKHNLDIGVTLTDCDHYVLNEHAVHIGPRGRGRACDSCYEDNVVDCEDGGYQTWRDDLYYHESDGNYYTYEEDDVDDYDSDNNDNEPNQLMSYSTNVLDILEPDISINSSTHGDFRMGIELEMCTRDMSVNSAVQDVRARLGEEYCIVKSDGSLPNNGMEIVSAPRGLAEHIRRFTAWDIDSDYRAWNTGKCGMHIHVHSKAFTGLTLGKFLMLVNSDENAVFIRQIAGRHPLHDSQARDYCASEQQAILDNPLHAIKGKYSSRYRMVNCENLTRAERDRLGLTCDIGKSFNTIELRIFKASLKKTRLLAQIEFTHALVMFCRVASWRDLNQNEFKAWHENRDLKQPSFIKWLKSTNNQYPNLCDWYGIRRRPNAKNSAPASVTCADTTSI